MEELGKEADCRRCIPDLMPRNIIPFRIFTMVKDQHIMGFKGPVDLQLDVVFKFLDIFGVKKEDMLEVINRVKLCYTHHMHLLFDELEFAESSNPSKPGGSKK